MWPNSGRVYTYNFSAMPMAGMIKGGGDVLHYCLLVIFNMMLVNHLPKQLPVGLNTAVYTSGDKGDISNYSGITVGSVIAKFLAMTQ